MDDLRRLAALVMACATGFLAWTIGVHFTEIGEYCRPGANCAETWLPLYQSNAELAWQVAVGAGSVMALTTLLLAAFDRLRLFNVGAALLALGVAVFSVRAVPGAGLASDLVLDPAGVPVMGRLDAYLWTELGNTLVVCGLVAVTVRLLLDAMHAARPDVVRRSLGNPAHGMAVTPTVSSPATQGWEPHQPNAASVPASLVPAARRGSRSAGRRHAGSRTI